MCMYSCVPFCFQVIPVSSATKAVRQYKGNAPYELVFEVAGPVMETFVCIRFVMMCLLLLFNFNQTALPALGYTMFNVIGTKAI